MLTLRTLKELIDTPERGEKLPTPKQLRTGESPVVAQSNGIPGKFGTWLWLFFCDRKEEKGR